MPFQNTFAWGRWLASPLRHSPERPEYICSLKAMCRPLAGGSAPTLVTIVNVSPSGLGFRAPCRFSKGEILHLDLPLARDPLLVCVGHTATCADSRWFIACAFVTGWKTDVLEAFRSALVPEKRASERFLCRIPVSYRDLALRGCWNEATIFDLSAGGICLVACRRIREGTTLWLNAPGVKAPVHVLRVDDLGRGRWKCGCSFLRELDEPSLLGMLSRRRTWQP